MGKVELIQFLLVTAAAVVINSVMALFKLRPTLSELSCQASEFLVAVMSSYLFSVLWQKMYGLYLRHTKVGKNPGVPVDTPTMWWKKQCVERYGSLH